MKTTLLTIFTLLTFMGWSQVISATVNGLPNHDLGEVVVGTSATVSVEIKSTFTKSVTVYLLGESNSSYPGVSEDSKSYCAGLEGAFELLENGNRVSSITLDANSTKTLTLKFSPQSFSYSQFVGFEQGCDPRDPQCGASGGGQMPICEPANSVAIGYYSTELLFNYNAYGVPEGNTTFSYNVTGEGVETTVGLNAISKEELVLYPNPTNTSVTISENAKWSLRSLLGNLLKEGFGNSIDMNDLENGLYIVETNNGVAIQQQKVIKN